jgi:RNA polymerase sigma-70 factor (ECF subfamily)
MRNNVAHRLAAMRLFWRFIRIADRMEHSLCLFVNSMEQETREIAYGLRRRDPDLLGELIGRYQYRLLRYLWSLTGNRETAEDLFQETWIRVLEKGHLYNPQWRFETWLFSIARNLAIDRLRRREPESLDLDALLHPRDERAAQEWPDRESATPFEAVAAGEQAERVKSVLGRLAPDAREVLVLRFQEDLDLNEIAEVVRAPLSTVKSRLYRGLEAFRNLLAEEEI